MAFSVLHRSSVHRQVVVPPPQLAPQHFLPPSPRELRAQAVHRLQIGLLGLAGMVLLVGLANIIMDRARVNDATVESAAASAAASRIAPATAAQSPGTDPLADVGVVPDLPADDAVVPLEVPPQGTSAGAGR